MRYRHYTEADKEVLLANLGPAAQAVTRERLDEAVTASLFTWAVEGTALAAVGGIITRTALSDECFAWLVCTRACNARYMKRLVSELRARYRVVHVAMDPAQTRAVRFTKWLGFVRTGELAEGFDHYELRNAP